MASTLQFLLIFTLIFQITTSFSHNPILPKAAILPIRKDPSTLQYIATVPMGENLVQIDLVVDINGPLVWVDCESNPSLRSHEPIESHSLKCSLASPVKVVNHKVHNSNSKKTCLLEPKNTVSRMSKSGDLNEGKMGLKFWDGFVAGSLAETDNFLFTCAPNFLLKDLADGAEGMLGLANSRISFPSQLSTTFGFFQRKFSLCLSKSKGAIFFGGSPFEQSEMMYTPLMKNGFLQNGYYIDVSSIKIAGKKVSLKQQKGFMRTKMSTLVPYTVLQRDIYRAFVDAYVEAAKEVNMTLVPRGSAAPFEVCFSSRGVGGDVPLIDLVLQSEMVRWRISGRNSMVDVGDDVMCLGFVDGGLRARDLIVVGGYQMEDYVLEFNLGNSMLGFSSLVMEEKNLKNFSDF